MSAPQQAQASSSSTWTEPPWSGFIESTGDALLILEAARRGLIPRVTRRLVDSERKMITSGSVFVFDEDESGIKRWTDGFFWSPSRILGNFLLYRETDKRGAGHRSIRADQELNSNETTFNNEGPRAEGMTLSRPRADSMGVDKHRERSLLGSLTNSYKFKPDGLMKKTFSLTINGVAQHLISYYKVDDVENGRLRSPSSLPELASLDISPEYLDKTHFRNPPKVEVGVDGKPRYRGEADDIDSTPTGPPPLTAPLSSSSASLLTEGRNREGASSGASKRGKRYDPYGSPTMTKRPRRNTKSSPPNTPIEESPESPIMSTSTATPQPPVQVQPPTPGYPDSNATMNVGTAGPLPPPPGAYPPYGHFYPGYPPPPPGHMYGPPPPPQPGVGVAGYPMQPPPANVATGAAGVAQSPQVPQQAPQYATYSAYPTAVLTHQVHGSDPSQAGSQPPPGSSLQQPGALAPASHQVQAQNPPPHGHVHPSYPQHQPPHQPQYYQYYPPPPPPPLHPTVHPGYQGPYQWPAYSTYPPQHQPPPMQPMHVPAQPHQMGPYQAPPLPAQQGQQVQASVGAGVQTKGEHTDADDA